MQFHNFKLLELPDQAHIVYRFGTYLGERGEDECCVVLYGLFDYYVEVFFRSQSGEIIKFISFHSEIFLEPYLQRIDLDGLLKPGQIIVKT